MTENGIAKKCKNKRADALRMIRIAKRVQQ